jgi:hypothetical protein
MPNSPDTIELRRRALALLPAFVIGASLVLAPGMALATGPTNEAAVPALAETIADQGREARAAMARALAEPERWAHAACDGLAQALGLPPASGQLTRLADGTRSARD